MSKVAIVTGGTRGIGEAISKGLKAAGYTVAATYAGNDAAAAKFKGETGVDVYKWDVGDAKACADGVAKVEAELGPIGVLVNNAGITRDGMFHRMTGEQWSAVIRTNLDSLFNMTRPVIEGMRARSFGRIISISSINGQKGQMGQVNYSTAKAGVIGFTKALGAGERQEGHHRQRDRARLHRDRDGAGGAAGGAEDQDLAADPGRPPRRGRRDRRSRGLPFGRQGGLHHRLDAFGEWRPVHGVSVKPCPLRLGGHWGARFLA